jgi:hypothetical protein
MFTFMHISKNSYWCSKMLTFSVYIWSPLEHKHNIMFVAENIKKVIETRGLKSPIFWNVAPCSMVKVYWWFSKASNRLYDVTSQK